MILNKNKNGFTLIELLVVVAMIATILASITVSMRAAQERARIQKATSDVKIISQAILSRENYAQGGDYKLEPIGGTSPDGGLDADKNTIRDLIGLGGAAESGGKIPATLMASLNGEGKMLDPWGTPYKVQIKPGNANAQITSASSSMQTGFSLPNMYRLSAEERK